MKTDDLISLLATGAAPVDTHASARRLSVALLGGLLTATVLVISVLGIRPDLPMVAVTPVFWAKVAFPLCVLAGALASVVRLARPGLSAGRGTWLIGAAIAATWAYAIEVLATAAPEARASVLLGSTWKVCPALIGVLSVPGFIATLRAMRGLAPTRLRLAGAGCGLVAGSAATLAYCLHCPEMGVPFWGVWYLLGMLLPTALGALLGPRWLRW